jgi:hypothetical protein
MAGFWLTVALWPTDILEDDDYEITRDFDFAVPGNREGTSRGTP